MCKNSLLENKFVSRELQCKVLFYPLNCSHVLQSLRPVFHTDSWDSFLYLLTDLLLGQAQAVLIRVSLVASPEYNRRRLPDLLRRNRLSASELMVSLTQLILLTTLYSPGILSHLFWVLDQPIWKKSMLKPQKDYCVTIALSETRTRTYPLWSLLGHDLSSISVDNPSLSSVVAGWNTLSQASLLRGLRSTTYPESSIAPRRCW